jgi:two-component system NtrC family sensor kinase
MNVINIAVCLVASLLYSLLFVFSLRGKRRVNRIFSAYLLGMGLWTSTSVMWFADFPVLGDLPWLQTGMFFSIIAWMLMCLLSVILLGLDSVPAVRVGLWVIYGLGGLLLVGDLAGQLLYVTRIERGHFDVQFGGLMYLFFALAGLSGVAFAFLFTRAGIKIDDHNQRNRLFYFTMSNILIIIGGLANISPQLRSFPFDVLFDVLAALLMAYAILRYQLLDLTVVIRKGLLYFVPTAIIGTSYFLLISLVVRLFHAFARPQILLVSLLVAVMTAVVAQPLRDRAQLAIDRFFFREKYDARLMLQRLSRTAASVLDLDRLTGMILDEVTTTIHIERAALFLKRERSGDFPLTAQRGLDQNASLRLRKDHPIVNWLDSHESALTRHDVEVVPQFKALWGEEREDLERMGAELFIPLEAKGELVGILAVGPKLSEMAYSQDDQLTLTTLANQAAVAIENARLYDVAQRELADRKRAEEALKEYSERLEEMVEERTLELQKAYSDVRASQVRLIQSEKLAATGRLAASVAHEINNPLQGIGNYLSLISKQVDEDDPLRGNLDMVKLGFDRIAEIVRRLRAFHRPVGEEMKPTDINGVVERALALVGHQLLLGQVKVKTELAEQELPVLGSAGQLEQVLINLALNAQEAMPEGGELTVRTALCEEMVKLQLADTGRGISEAEMSKLFKPFYGGGGGKGLGLGLWISHNIIEGHGGRIEVESQLDEGTTFTISLPAYQQER